MPDPALAADGGRQDGVARPSGPRAHGELPEYSLRVSARARRVRLVMSPERGLEVVVPRGFDRRMIPGLIEKKKAWIERATARVEEKRRRLEIDPPRLPERIVLAALNEEWVVEYVTAPEPAEAAPVRRASGAVARERSPGRLVVVCGVGDPSAGKEALCRWLSRKARAQLVPRLAELAHQHGFVYARAIVRQQRSRWASCSHRRTISLNARLLFLAPEVVDHVLLHELCHTREMNHSPRFWALLEACDPGYRAHRRRLRDRGKTLPTWLEHDVSGTGNSAL